MKIKFKEKHLCFIVNHLSNIVLIESFKLVYEIKSKVNNNNYQPNDLVEIEVTPESVISIYNDLGYKPEYIVSQINREMKQSLIEQFTEKITAYYTLIATKPEINDGDYTNVTAEDMIVLTEANEVNVINTAITSRAEVAEGEIQSMITNGRSLINN